jgi:hypothetical protein
MADVCLNINVIEMPQPDCTDGEIKCEDGYLYNCVDETWVKSSQTCEDSGDNPECKSGASRCGDDGYEYVCVAGKWAKSKKRCDTSSDPVSECIEIPFLPQVGCIPTTYVFGTGVILLVILLAALR